MLTSEISQEKLEAQDLGEKKRNVTIFIMKWQIVLLENPRKSILRL